LKKNEKEIQNKNKKIEENIETIAKLNETTKMLRKINAADEEKYRATIVNLKRELLDLKISSQNELDLAIHAYESLANQIKYHMNFYNMTALENNDLKSLDNLIAFLTKEKEGKDKLQKKIDDLERENKG